MFVLLTNNTLTTENLTILVQIVPEKSFLHSSNKFLSTQVATKRRRMQIRQDQFDQLLITGWDDRTEIVTHQLTYDAIM